MVTAWVPHTLVCQHRELGRDINVVHGGGWAGRRERDEDDCIPKPLMAWPKKGTLPPYFCTTSIIHNTTTYHSYVWVRSITRRISSKPAFSLTMWEVIHV